MPSKRKDANATALAAVRKLLLEMIECAPIGEVGEDEDLCNRAKQLMRHVADGDIYKAVVAAMDCQRRYDKLQAMPITHAAVEAKKRWDKVEKENEDRHTDRQTKINLARELWTEYDPSDVKGKDKRKAAHKEIGQIMQLRLGLSEPIPASAVQEYLKKRKGRDEVLDGRIRATDLVAKVMREHRKSKKTGEA